MTAFPRALLMLALVALALVPAPMAAAGDCVEVNTTTFSEGMRIIATAGRTIALGFRTGAPGDGLGFVVEITPALCTGVGIGSLELSGVDPAGTANGVVAQVPKDQLPVVLPLP